EHLDGGLRVDGAAEAHGGVGRRAGGDDDRRDGEREGGGAACSVEGGAHVGLAGAAGGRGEDVAGERSEAAVLDGEGGAVGDVDAAGAGVELDARGGV